MTKVSMLARLAALSATYMVLVGASCAPIVPTTSEHPQVTAGVTFFYYDDLAAATDWYENKLKLKKIASKDWVVIFEMTPSSQIGLVNATGGSLVPAKDKGALLSIETDELETWYEFLKDEEGINMIHGIEVGGQGMVDEFRMYDPGGYVVEFYRWKLAPNERF